MNRLFGLFFLSMVAFCSCEQKADDLPILGQHDYITEYRDGELKTDTIFYTIPEFQFTDQNGESFDENSVGNKIYVTDFFFTSCPTICPKMSKNMLELSKQYQDNPNIIFVSHSIDTRHDSVPVLKQYAERLDAPSNWYFLTGEKDDIFGIAEKYMVSAAEDEHAPGGVIHSGAFILVDSERRVRAYYDGTKKEEMPKLQDDIKTLLEK